ncbi:MAG: TlpA family protein disulfide reductase [Sediminibacterium sp.]
MTRTYFFKKLWKKQRTFVLLFILSFFVVSTVASQKNIRLPLVRKLEKGVFNPRRTFGTYISDTKSFSFDSTNYSLFAIWKFSFDEMQHDYNIFLSKNRNDSNFFKIQKRYGWDTSQINPGFDNDIYILAGIRKDGKYVIIPDRNRDKNFSNEVVNFYRLSKVPNDSLKILTRLLPILKLPIKLSYNGKIIERKVAVQFVPKSYFGNFKVGFSPKAADSLVFTSAIHQYLEGQITRNKMKRTIVIRNASPDVRYNNIESVEAYVLPESGKVPDYLDRSLTYSIGDTIAVGLDLYKFLNIDPLGAYIDISYVGKNNNIGITAGLYAKYFSFTDIVDKRPLSLDDYKGKYLLIDFWGTWCAPCKEILPDIKKMSINFQNKGFKVLSIANDNNVSVVKKFIQSEGMVWDHYFIPFENSKDGDIISEYKIQSYPTTILVDPTGKILFRATSTTEFKIIKDYIENIFK